MGRRSYTVVGLGGVGGLYGGRLLAAGHEVHFLVRSSADRIRQAGLHLRSPYGDVDVDDPSVHDDARDVPPTDVVIVATKTTANPSLAHVLPHLTRTETIVAAFQNGLGVEADLARIAHDGATVLGGLCFVCSVLTEPGRIDHVDYGTVTLGEHRADGAAAGITDAVEAVATDLEGASVQVKRNEDLVEARWRKLVWNVPYNGLSVVLDSGTDELNANADTRALVSDLKHEVRAGAEAAAGRRIPESFVHQMLADTDAMTPYSPSMKLDYEAGRPLELEAIYERPIAAARAAGYHMVRTEMLWRQLRLLDQRNLAEDDLRPTLGGPD